MMSDLETLGWVNASPPMNAFIPEPFKLLPIPSAVFAIWDLYRVSIGESGSPLQGGPGLPSPSVLGKGGSESIEVSVPPVQRANRGGGEGSPGALSLLGGWGVAWLCAGSSWGTPPHREILGMAFPSRFCVGCGAFRRDPKYVCSWGVRDPTVTPALHPLARAERL